MKLIKGDYYKISFKINATILTYTCQILDDDENFVTFIDKFGHKKTFNKNILVGIEELNKEEKENEFSK